MNAPFPHSVLVKNAHPKQIGWDLPVIQRACRRGLSFNTELPASTKQTVLDRVLGPQTWKAWTVSLVVHLLAGLLLWQSSHMMEQQNSAKKIFAPLKIQGIVKSPAKPKSSSSTPALSAASVVAQNPEAPLPDLPADSLPALEPHAPITVHQVASTQRQAQATGIELTAATPTTLPQTEAQAIPTTTLPDKNQGLQNLFGKGEQTVNANQNQFSQSKVTLVSATPLRSAKPPQIIQPPPKPAITSGALTFNLGESGNANGMDDFGQAADPAELQALLAMAGQFKSTKDHQAQMGAELSQETQKLVNQYEERFEIEIKRQEVQKQVVAELNPEEVQRYHQELRHKLESLWNLPQHIDRNLMEGRVRFKIDKEGRILEYKLESMSKDDLFNNSIKNLLASIKFLPPLPESYSGSEYEFGINFMPANM